MNEPFEVKLLTAKDDTSRFRCGEEQLDEYLQKYALSMNNSGGPRTRIAITEDGEIVGYYSLTSSSIEHDVAPQRLRAGMGSYRISTMLVARLAVDMRYQGHGIGSDLLLHALMIAVSVADEVGTRAVEVDALNEKVVSLYERHSFTALNPQKYPLHLYALMKDVRKELRAHGLL